MITAHPTYIAFNRHTYALRTLVWLCITVLLVTVGQPHANVVAAGFAPVATPAAESAAIHGQVWNDVNHDGIRQSPEPGIAGITVTLNLSGTALFTPTLTDITGHYTFTHLQPATYTLRFLAPTNFSFTLFGLGPNATDNVARADGQTDPVVLQPGNLIAQIDAGVWQSALVSDGSATAEKRTIFLPFIASSSK